MRGHAPEIKPLDQEAEQSDDALRVDGREMAAAGLSVKEENGLNHDPAGEEGRTRSPIGR